MLHDNSSSCNRDHDILPLAQKLGHLKNHTLASCFLPGLLCVACQNCVAVYKPEDLSNCHSTSAKSHFKKIDDILRSNDCQKVSDHLKINK